MRDMREYTGQNKGMVKRIITWGVTLGILIGVGTVGLEYDYEVDAIKGVVLDANVDSWHD